MSLMQQDPLEHPEVKLASGRSYVIGYFISIALLGVSLWMATGHALPPMELQIAVSGIALAVVLAQVYFLFHLNFSETQRWHTLALVLMIPLFILLIGLSFWMFLMLDARTMIPGVG
jgi:cytochrome o ubiquinol oxidase operon protein cyoD